LNSVNIDDFNDLEPLTVGLGDFSVVCNFRLWHTFQEWIAPKWLKINRSKLC